MTSVSSPNKGKQGSNNIAQDGKGKNVLYYKVLVIGEPATGKTSIIQRYTREAFSRQYKVTIGVDFALKVLDWDPKTEVRLQLWDIAGQERFVGMTRVYYKEALGALLCFDVSRPQTFEAVVRWKKDLDSKVGLPNGQPLPVVLIANKCDLPKEGLCESQEKMDQYCEQNGFIGWFLTSAKDDINLDKAVKFLVRRIMECMGDSPVEDAADDPTIIKAGQATGEKKSQCCFGS